MATKIETLKKPNGDQVLPRTKAKAVSMEDGATVEAAIADINTIVNNLPDLGEHNTSVDAHANMGWLTSKDGMPSEPTPFDADTLNGHDADYFAKQDEVGTAVLYTVQTLNDDEKRQARSNIGAASDADLSVERERINDVYEDLTVESNRIDDVFNDIANIKNKNGTWTTRKPFVTFVADDGYEQDITILEPIFKKYNVPCCIAMISTQINNLEERLELQENYGWEFMCHSINSTPFTSMTLEDAENAMVESKTTLETVGFNIKDIVYPSGYCNSEIKQIAKKYFRAGCEFNPHYTLHLNTGIIDSFSILRVPLGSFTYSDEYSTLEYYKSCVDNAITNNGWVVFCLHSGAEAFDAIQQQYLDDLIAYIQGLGVEIGNLSDGYEIFGNYIECGTSTNASVPRTDAELNKFVVANTGEHNLPIQKLMPLVHTNNDTITNYPLNKISIAEISNWNAGFPTGVGGTLITSRFDNFGFQIWIPDNSSYIYKRSWNYGSNDWRSWDKATFTSTASSTASSDALISRKFVLSDAWSDNFKITITSGLYIKTFDIIGSPTATLTKKYFNLSEISTDANNPTIIGTTSEGLDIQMYYHTGGYLLIKYSEMPSTYNAYVEIAYL